MTNSELEVFHEILNNLGFARDCYEIMYSEEDGSGHHIAIGMSSLFALLMQGLARIADLDKNIAMIGRMEQTRL
jgi:hypothetical protein